ncbi:hypothetical protein [Candidatus Villigracilis saccharophilus]|uniref:hypothetical protein n=1 Tax=Candidatus Villigracilis saccharophilus TaxID=3140684 RepID=UPI0031EA66F4
MDADNVRAKKGAVGRYRFFHTMIVVKNKRMIVIGRFAVPDQFSSLPINSESVVKPQRLSVRSPLAFNIRIISCGQFGIWMNAIKLNMSTLRDAEIKKDFPPRKMAKGMNMINKCGLNRKMGNNNPA